MKHEDTILIVEDDAGVAALERMYLERAAYRTVVAATAEEALAHFQHQRIALILLDNRLAGDMDGLDLYAQVRAAGFEPPVILVTGFSDEATAILALRAGVRDFIVKSAEFLELLPDAVQRVLKQVRVEQQLAQSEERFRQVWDKSIDGMRLTDPAGIITAVNDAFCRMVGLPRDGLVGKPYTVIYREPQEEMLPNHRERFAARTVEPYFTKDVVLWNGHKAHFELSNSILELPGEGPLLLSIVRDSTEQRNLEAQFRQAQKMEAIGRLAGGIAHDFNNLLTIINGFGEVILSGMVPPEQHPEMVREICRASERAAGLTRQLLAFSRKQTLQPVELNLNELVIESEKMLRRLIGADIDLATRLDPQLAHVKADAGQMQQVIMNLAVNARDAMPVGGHLTIETKNVELDDRYAYTHPVTPGEYVLLAVSDSGCGMDDETKTRMFEPFFTTKGVGEGTGLGLATVHGIVKQSGGSIEVYSELLRGTSVKIYLPRIAAARPAAKSAEGAATPQGHETVLIAEDDEAVRGLLQLALSVNGYKVLAAAHGEQAIQLSQQHADTIHLLITDVVMPKINGRQLAEIIGAARPGIKVLYLSGYTDDAVIRHGVLEKGVAFLQKPFTPLVFARKVREVLGST